MIISSIIIIITMFTYYDIIMVLMWGGGLHELRLLHAAAATQQPVHLADLGGKTRSRFPSASPQHSILFII